MSTENRFPIVFRLEKVQNGYIFTPRVGKKEALTHDVEKRLGQLFHVEELKDERPVDFMVEAILNPVKPEEQASVANEMMKNKLLYVKFCDTEPDTFLILQNNGNYEILGAKADAASKILDMPLQKIDGTNIIRLPQGKDSGKFLRQLGKFKLVEATDEQIAEWTKSKLI